MKNLVSTIQQRILGRTGIKVRMLGVGGISPQNVVEKALEYGLNFYDVHGYKDERGIDNRIRFRNAFEISSLKRSDVVLTARSYALTREELLMDLYTSLDTLGTDYIDIYGPYNVTQTPDRVEKLLAPGGALDGLKEAKASGKIRFIGGVSGHHHKEMVQLLKTNEFDAVMAAVNIFDQDVINTVLPVAREMNIGTIVMKPFAKGLFTKSADAALQYVFSQDISVAIPGMMTIQELENNIRTAARFCGRTSEAMEILKKEADEIVSAEGLHMCRQCGYCVPVCPKQIDIKALFYLERQANRYYNGAWAKEEYAKVKNNADECVECGNCEKECPYDLPIRERLKQIHFELKK